MNELIKVKNASYELYEELLLKRDHLYKEAESILIYYTQEFGTLITEVFEAKIECIRLKKAITYCQMMVNRGNPVNVQLLNDYLEEHMTVYYAELNDMLLENESAKNAKISSLIDVEQAKKIYRRLAKQLHPDINPMTEKIAQLKDLWNRITLAYHANQSRELSELEILVNKAIEDLGMGVCEIEIPDIEERICALEAEIHEILTTEPYIYEKILNDSEAVETKRKELETEKEEYVAYQKELEELLHKVMSDKEGSFLWTMN